MLTRVHSSVSAIYIANAKCDALRVGIRARVKLCKQQRRKGWILTCRSECFRNSLMSKFDERGYFYHERV